MKLKNKKTGEIGTPRIEYQEFYIDTEDHVTYCYKTLHKVYKEWEDITEELKEYWYINCYGEVLHAFYNGNEWDERRKQIGNYFETKKEAEKAVERLRARKRLKDKGFRVSLRGWKGNTWLYANWGSLRGDYSDALLLFGGEE